MIPGWTGPAPLSRAPVLFSAGRDRHPKPVVFPETEAARTEYVPLRTRQKRGLVFLDKIEYNKKTDLKRL